MASYSTITLLDGNTFEPVWRADHCYDAVSSGEHVVSHDGNHSVTCRNVHSGQVSWNIDMQGGWRLVAANGKVLVHTPDYTDRRSALRVLDIESGRQVLRHEAAPEFHWKQVYFDGRLIYMVEDHAPSGDQSSAGHVRVSTLDLEGKAVAKVDFKSPEIVAATPQDNAEFIWGDKYFQSGRVKTVNPHQRGKLAELWKKDGELRNMQQGDGGFYRSGNYPPQLLPTGIFANFPVKDSDGEMGQMLQLIMPNGSWTAYAPHLGKNGSITHVAEADGKLLLGSNEGQLECVDSETGRPQWLYTFPVIRQTMSYSSPHGLPPYMAQRAAEFRREADKAIISSGSILLPLDFQPGSRTWSKLCNEAEYPGRIVADPNADDPFPKLTDYYAWLAVCTFLPVGGGLVYLLTRRVRRKRLRKALPEAAPGKMPASSGVVVWFLALSIPPAYGLLEYGRVSLSWTLALKLIYIVAIALSAFGTIRLFVARRWIFAVLFSLLLVGWFVFMLAPLMFA